MKPKDREEFAENFYGVDRILYDRLEKKTGNIQQSTTKLTAEQIM